MPEKVNKPIIKELAPTVSTAPIPKPITQKTTPKPLLKKPLYETTSAQQEPIKKIKPTYRYAGRENPLNLIKKSIPKQLIPTNRLAKILGLIFLATAILAVIQFPFTDLLAGNTDIIIGIGYPMPFVELNIGNPEAPPLRPLNLFLDIIIYLILSYIIDILITLTTNISLLKSKEKLSNRPKIYKKIKPTIAEKMTKKVFKNKPSPPNTQPQPPNSA